MKKLTKREKVIIGGAAIILLVVTNRLNRKLGFASFEYNRLANKLCSGGIWMATDITPKSFKLIQATLDQIK